MRWGVERWVPLPELAERSGVCERTLRNWRDAGKFPIRRLGGFDTGRGFGMTESEFIAWLNGSLRWAYVDGQYHIDPSSVVHSETPDAQRGGCDA